MSANRRLADSKQTSPEVRKGPIRVGCQYRRGSGRGRRGCAGKVSHRPREHSGHLRGV